MGLLAAIQSDIQRHSRSYAGGADREWEQRARQATTACFSPTPRHGDLQHLASCPVTRIPAAVAWFAGGAFPCEHTAIFARRVLLKPVGAFKSFFVQD